MSTKNLEELRDYQVELFRKIEKRKNCILFLPAGSGKTRIAFTVIDSMIEELERPIANNGKRAFFLVNTVHLVRQQGEVLSKLGNIRVSSLTGDSKKTSWRTLLSSFQVFVLTSQIFLNALTHGYFALENVNILIFDECHHATGDHPMAQIMARVRTSGAEVRPKVLGLTATLFKTNLKNTKADFQRKLKDLQQIFEADIITSAMNKQIKNRYSAKPTDIIENVQKYSVPKRTQEKLNKVSEDSMKILQTVKIGECPPIPVDLDENDHVIQLDKPDANRLNQFKNIFSDILFHTNEYGLFMGHVCCQYYIEQMDRYMQALRDSRSDSLLLYTINQTRLMREILFDNILAEKSVDENNKFVNLTQLIQKTSSGKIQCLFNRLRNIKPSDRCIIFVMKKMTAKSLYRILKGPQRSNRKEAKQAAALEVVILLHKEKILDDFLNPVTMKNSCAFDSDEDVSVTSPLTNKIVHAPIRVPVFLKNSRPVAMLQCHLHVLKFTSEAEPSTVRHRFCNELMRSERYNYGILTRQKWPEICGFPVYSDIGEIHVELEPNNKVLLFPQSRIQKISHFHRTLFVNVLNAARKCFAYDENRNCDNGYYIVPLRQKEDKTYEIWWSCIDTEFPTEISKPTDEDIDKQEYTAQNYVGKVATQWYKPGVPHIIFDISDKLFLKSRFLSTTYEKYFEEKHGVVSRRPDHQPLLLARPIMTLNDSIRPKHGPGKEKKVNKVDKGSEIHLAPEFAYVYPFSAVLWYKSTILPSTLHRIQHLLLAEDLRQRIVSEAKVGLLKVPREEIPSRCEVFQEQRTCKIFLFQSENIVTPVKVSKRRVSERIHKVLQPKRKEELDWETREWQYGGREHDATVDNCTVVEKFDDRYSSSTTLLVDVLNDLTKTKSIDYFDLASVARLKMKNTADDCRSAPFFKKIPANGIQIPEINFVSTPVLSTLKNHDGECGPKSHEILEAITLRDAQDILHLERLETLGDSCLKYLVSFHLYTNGKNMDEGELTIMKSELVSNKNLFNCGEKLEIGSYIKVTNFSSKVFWCPPGFSIPSCFLPNQPVQDAHVDEFSSLLSLDIPQSEQVTGKISEATKNQEMKNTELDGISAIREVDFLLKRQKLTPKSISDVLEALLGVYSIKTGIKNAFKLLHYFGILKDVGKEIPRDIANLDSTSSVHQFLPKTACDAIERLTKYEFKNKLHLLQALTHASFSENYLTHSYEKFEFLGDAILDFLVTSFLYEYHQHLDPGQLTDLRSALVNNITFGSLSMRLGLHQFLLCRSEALLEAIRTFEVHQKKKNHAIALDEFMTVKSENNVTIAEEVDVPKALGDIFESIAAAVYIDSGFNLEVVWRIYFNFMRNEIEKFCNEIPINPVRELYEKQFDLCFTPVENDRRSSKAIVSLQVVTKTKKKFLFTGRGDNSKAAKRAAARFALKNLNNDDFLVK